jgi:hypothetical protein
LIHSTVRDNRENATAAPFGQENNALCAGRREAEILSSGARRGVFPWRPEREPANEREQKIVKSFTSSVKNFHSHSAIARKTVVETI